MLAATHDEITHWRHPSGSPGPLPIRAYFLNKAERFVVFATLNLETLFEKHSLVTLSELFRAHNERVGQYVQRIGEYLRSRSVSRATQQMVPAAAFDLPAPAAVFDLREQPTSKHARKYVPPHPSAPCYPLPHRCRLVQVNRTSKACSPIVSSRRQLQHIQLHSNANTWTSPHAHKCSSTGLARTWRVSVYASPTLILRLGGGGWRLVAMPTRTGLRSTPAVSLRVL